MLLNKKARVKLLISLSIAFILAILFLLSTGSKPYQILELKALDLRFALKGDRQAPNAPIVHIDIDDESLAALGRWPWPRHYHAQLTDILKECEASKVLMDVLFTEEYKDNPQEDVTFSKTLAATGITYLPFYFAQKPFEVPPELHALLLKDITLSLEAAAQKLGVDERSLKDKLPAAKKAVLDEAIHDLVRKDPGISFDVLIEQIEKAYGWFLFPEDEAYIQEHLSAQIAARAFIRKFSMQIPSNGWAFREELRRPNPPIAVYAQTIKGSGFINADPDMDGVTRRVPLFLKHEDILFPQLTVAALLDRLGVDRIDATKDRVILKNAHMNGRVKDVAIPVDPKGCMLVNWTGRWGTSFDHISYRSILKLQEVRDQIKREVDGASGGDKDSVAYFQKTEKELMQKLKSMVKGKICIVGLTATGTNDLHPVPLQEDYPMVGTHSNLAHTILSEQFIVKVDGIVRLVIFILTALIITGSSLLKLWKSFLLSFGFGAAYFLAAFFLFTKFGIWIDLVGPMGILVFGFALVTSYRFFTEEKEKLWIKQAFSHYLSDEVISELMEDPDRLKLGGERRLITVLFSDIRGFTAFSESREPEEVVGMLNEILSEQVDVVFKHGGTLDKFVGDELMAFFGAPGTRHLKDHALVAVRVAVEIQARMAVLQEERIRDNKHPLQIGIGINTGDMVVGNMGSSVRMDYTVIGDNVNLGARLCSAAGKNEIIISEATYSLVAEHVQAEKLEPIAVKGKVKPISIYKVTGLKQG
jgi:adenylate cyclase